MTTQFSLIKIKFIIQNKKLSDLHTAQSNSYNSVDNNDFMHKGDENNNKSNKSQSSSEFHNTSFNKTFNTEVSIDDVINSYSEPTKELVISSYKNMNNDNNSKSVENSIAECNVDTTVFIVHDTNKINDSEKRIKENQTGKAVVHKNMQKVFILGDSIVKHIQGWEITKKLDDKQKVYVRQFSGSKVSCMKDYVKPPIRENNLDHIFHVGTNDAPSEKTPQVIAQSIVGLVKTCK